MLTSSQRVRHSEFRSHGQSSHSPMLAHHILLQSEGRESAVHTAGTDHVRPGTGTTKSKTKNAASSSSSSGRHVPSVPKRPGDVWYSFPMRQYVFVQRMLLPDAEPLPTWLLHLVRAEVATSGVEGSDAVLRHQLQQQRRVEEQQFGGREFATPPSGEKIEKFVAPFLAQGVMPYQVEGVRFALRKNGRCLFADEMGLGKSLQALLSAAFWEQEWPVLVICPASLRFGWKDQALKWLGGGKKVLSTPLVGEEVQIVLDGKTKIDPTARVVVVTYNLLAKHKKFRINSDKEPFKVVIVDESQFIKDAKSKQTEAVLEVAFGARRCFLLSGTPALNQAKELFTQLKALVGKRVGFPNFWLFTERYCEKKDKKIGRTGQTVVEISGVKRAKELNTVLRATCLIRRRKGDVLKDLPAKLRGRITLDPDLCDREKMAEVRRLIREMYRQLKLAEGAEIPEHALLGAGGNKNGPFHGPGAGAPGSSSTATTGQTAAVQELEFVSAPQIFAATAQAKIKPVLSYIDLLMTEQPTLKFIVFAHHRVMLDAIEESLRWYSHQRNTQTVAEEFRVRAEAAVLLGDPDNPGGGSSSAAAPSSSFYGGSSVRAPAYIRIDGSTKQTDRPKLVTLFQEDPGCRVALLSITACGQGLTLTAATAVVFAELYWVPGQMQQAEGTQALVILGILGTGL